MHRPEFLGIDEVAGTSTIRVLDLTNTIPGFPSSSQIKAISTIEDIKSWILASCKELGRSVQVYIDDIDTLAEDYGSVSAIAKMVKDVVKTLAGLKGQLDNAPRKALAYSLTQENSP